MDIKSKEIKMVSIHSIVENPKNANRHSIEQIKRLEKLIEYQGFRVPLIISNRTGFLIAGHGRLEAAKNLDIEKVPVVFQDFENEAQEYAFLVSDNEIARWAELDRHSVYTEMENMELEEFDIELLGIEDFSLEVEEIPGSTDKDEVPELKEDPITKKGDIWILGDHRLMCGDSTMVDDIEKLMNGEKADLVVTDPPYKIETKGGCKGEVGSSLRKQGKDIEFISDFNPKDFLNIIPIIFNKNKFNAYVFCNKELLPDYLLWAREKKISFNVLVWKKPNAIPIGDSHRPDIEYLILFRKNAIWNNGLKNVNYSRCLEYSRETGLHPTMKPVELLENEIMISSHKKSIVLDFFNGSGSTMIACEKSSRNYRGIELLPSYCDVTIQRWQNYTGKEAVLESTGEKYNQLVKSK